MSIVGVDPGTRHLGWGVVSADGNRLVHVAHGVIHTSVGAPLATRLAEIDVALAQVLAEHRPRAGSVETLFFHKDPQAAAKLGHARGVVLLALVRARVEVFEYAPALVKRSTVGSGRADKRQMARMVATVLGLEEPPPSDAADALALAITHIRRAHVERAKASARGSRGGVPAVVEAARAAHAKRRAASTARGRPAAKKARRAAPR